MAGISSKALAFGNPENKYKYNGIEKENDLQIDVYDAQLRELDGQTGRWWQIDPKVDDYEMWSPYASNYDNPIRYSDPLGDEGRECCEGLKQFLGDMVVRLEATVMGAVNGMTGGATPKDPIIPQEFDSWQQDIYDQTFEVARVLGSVFNPLGARIITKVLPIPGETVALKPTTVTISPPAPSSPSNTDRANSSSNSSSGANKNTSQNQQKQSKVEKSTKTEPVGNGKYTKTTEVKPGKGPGQSRAEYIRYKNSDGKTIKVVKDSYDRGNKFQHRKIKLPISGSN